MRARIVLSCDAGCSNRESAKRLKVTEQTVGKWRARFVAHGIQGLADQPRSGAPRSISDALVEAVLAKTLHDNPPGAARWSSRRLAATLGVSQRTVMRIWRTFEL
jgi:transposase